MHIKCTETQWNTCPKSFLNILNNHKGAAKKTGGGPLYAFFFSHSASGAVSEMWFIVYGSTQLKIASYNSIETEWCKATVLMM